MAAAEGLLAGSATISTWPKGAAPEAERPVVVVMGCTAHRRNQGGMFRSVERVGVNKEELKRIGICISVVIPKFAPLVANTEMANHQGQHMMENVGMGPTSPVA